MQDLKQGVKLWVNTFEGGREKGQVKRYSDQSITQTKSHSNQDILIKTIFIKLEGILIEVTLLKKIKKLLFAFPQKKPQLSLILWLMLITS